MSEGADLELEMELELEGFGMNDPTMPAAHRPPRSPIALPLSSLLSSLATDPLRPIPYHPPFPDFATKSKALQGQITKLGAEVVS